MQKDARFYAKKKYRLILTILITLVMFFVVLPLVTYYYFAPDLSSKQAIMNKNDGGIILLDKDNQPFFSFYQAKYKDYTTLDKISPNLQNAVVAVEDKDFYSHPGFSFKGIIRAFFANLLHKDISQGGSTLTQQLMKNSLLNSNKTFARKYAEIVLAMEMERRYSKKEILEMYLNSVYFGEGAFGAEEAAQVYFGTSAKDLDLAQAAMIAGVLPSPSAYSPLSGDEQKAIVRQHLVLKDLLDQKYITQQQYDEAINEKLTYNTNHDVINTTAPHFALMVRDALIQQYGEETVIRSGFKVKTTLDKNWQEYAENVVHDQVAKLAPDHVSNGAAVVMDPKTGEIRALVGSEDWYNEKFGKVNMAVTPRQPGSSFKPIIYSYAFANHLITPATLLPDKPTTFPGGYKPLDYDRKFRGEVTPRRALSNSLNIPAVEVMNRVGVSNALSYAKQVGITTLGDDTSQYGLSLVLGAGEVKLVELTGFYAALADQGIHHDPTAILQITDKQNNVIYNYNPEETAQQAIDPGAAYIISSILSDNNARAEEFGNVLNISRTAAVKTGTTDDYKDALTMGYTPSLAVGVWVGNNDHTAMDQIAGSLGAAPIWKQLMEHFLAGTPVEQFQKPSDIVQVVMCSNAGYGDKDKVASGSGRIEYFMTGTQPSKDCSVSPTPSVSPTISPTPTLFPTPSNSPTSTPFPSATPRPTATPPQISPTITLPLPSPTGR